MQKNGLVFKLMPQLPALCLGPTPALWSFFVLGGDFWDKVKALLIRSARAQFNS
jgi:hypothetical protein